MLFFFFQNKAKRVVIFVVSLVTFYDTRTRNKNDGKRRRKRFRREAHRRASVHIILPDMRALILLGDFWIVREISNRWKSRGVRPDAQVALGARRAFRASSSSSSRVRM
jgi:hypothetical protein